MTTVNLHESAGAKAVLGASSALLVVSLVFAAFLPKTPDGFVAGAAGSATNTIAGVAFVAGWISAVWHALTLKPWTGTVPRWVMIVVLVFGAGVAAFFYYFFYARGWSSRISTR